MSEMDAFSALARALDELEHRGWRPVRCTFPDELVLQRSGKVTGVNYAKQEVTFRFQLNDYSHDIELNDGTTERVDCWVKEWDWSDPT